MAQTNVNIRMDEATKVAFDKFCDEIGLSVSSAFNIFAKTVVREQRIPFEVGIDPFYSSSNQKALKDSLDEYKAGKVIEKTVDELLHLEND